MPTRLADGVSSLPPSICEAVREHLQERFGLRHDGRERLAAGVEDAARFLGLTPEAVVERMRSPEVEAALLSSLTTPESYFLRQPEQLEWVFETTAARREVVRIWSVGCARGEEPYSLAILAQERFGVGAPGRVRIVGSDVNADAIRRAQSGTYRAWSFRGVAESVRLRFFDAAPDADGRDTPASRTWRVKPDVRSMVRFQAVNLARPDATWPVAQDVIFCRNVLLYLDASTFSAALVALHRQLKPGGLFVVSSAEAPFVRGPFQAVAGAPIGVFRAAAVRGVDALPPPTRAELFVAPSPAVDALPAPPDGRDHALARAYEQANRGLAARAMATVEALLRDHPLFAAGYLARAILRLEAGAEMHARADLLRARRLDPTLSVAALLAGTSPRRVEGSAPSAEIDAIELASLERTMRRLEEPQAPSRAEDSE